MLNDFERKSMALAKNVSVLVLTYCFWRTDGLSVDQASFTSLDFPLPAWAFAFRLGMGTRANDRHRHYHRLPRTIALHSYPVFRFRKGAFPMVAVHFCCSLGRPRGVFCMARRDGKRMKASNYTSGEYNYLIPTCASHEGLEQVAAAYKKIDHFKDRSLEQLQKDLKWSHSDSPLHEVGWEHFETLKADIDEVAEQLDALYDADDFSGFDDYVGKIESCVISALKELDQRGVFGTEEERKEIVLNFVMGDQDNEDRIRLASLLNTTEQLESYER